MAPCCFTSAANSGGEAFGFSPQGVPLAEGARPARPRPGRPSALQQGRGPRQSTHGPHLCCNNTAQNAVHQGNPPRRNGSPREGTATPPPPQRKRGDYPQDSPLNKGNELPGSGHCATTWLPIQGATPQLQQGQTPRTYTRPTPQQQRRNTPKHNAKNKSDTAICSTAAAATAPSWVGAAAAAPSWIGAAAAAPCWVGAAAAAPCWAEPPAGAAALLGWGRYALLSLPVSRAWRNPLCTGSEGHSTARLRGVRVTLRPSGPQAVPHRSAATTA